VWQTASNAAIAQQALSVVTGAVTSGSAQEVSYTGGSTLPALSNATIKGVVLAEGAGSAAHAPFQLSGNYNVAISNDSSSVGAAPQGVLVGIGAVGDQVFIGGGGGGVVNFGTATEVFFTGASSVQSFQNGGFPGTSPSAQVWMDGNATVDGSVGSTTVHIDDLIATGTPTAPALGSEVFLSNNGSGRNTVNIATSNSTVANSAATDFVFLTGNSSVAATINAAGSAASGAPTVTGAVQPALWVIGGNLGVAGSASVAGGSSQIIAFGGTSPMTVDGGTAKNDIAAFVGGKFQAGTGGGAIMAGSLSDGVATTLIGGGNNDVFFGLSNNTTMMAGLGNETMAGFAAAPASATISGTTFEGNLGAGASTTTMLMETGAHSRFVTGNGTDIVSALTGSIGGAAVGNVFQEGVTGTGLTNTATITGFNAAVDTISTDIAGGGNYTTILTGTPTATQILLQPGVGGGNSTLTFGDGSKWTIVGATVTGQNFHST